MTKKFTQSFKIQAVQKALSRSEDTRLEEFAGELGVGYSTLQKWIRQSKNQELNAGLVTTDTMKNERRPQDWNAEERLNMIIQCAALDEPAVAELCRQKGLYPHHITQWKADFSSENPVKNNTGKRSDAKQLKTKIKQLEKEINRKDKALAETAALLVLQKKVNAIWGSDEDSSQ